MKQTMIVNALVCAFVAVSSPVMAVNMSKSVPKGWIEDFSVAREMAAKEGKNILLVFSGSDWCGWCVRMDREVYSDKKFMAKAKEDFILVMIDTPANKSILSKVAERQNPELLKKYGIRGFPCSVVVTPDGSEVKRFSGYQRGGPAAFLEELQAVRNTSTKVQKKITAKAE